MTKLVAQPTPLRRRILLWRHERGREKSRLTLQLYRSYLLYNILQERQNLTAMTRFVKGLVLQRNLLNVS